MLTQSGSQVICFYIIINIYHLTGNQFYTVFMKLYISETFYILNLISEIIAYFIALSMVSVTLGKQM